MPIDLPDGGELVTLRDAAAYIAKVPATKHKLPHWQLAGQLLIDAAEGRGPRLHARIAMLKAIHHGEPSPTAEPRKKQAKAYNIIQSQNAKKAPPPREGLSGAVFF
ncbi:hypothetical protein LJR220_003314 [Bradyrhizobium sp. LjRoot220]|uniref:hypothetical protein n=1 Tax=Bradyrhizobium sp. LjRoot220 TaxID=3342284 RepID=UPI003ECF72FB